MSPKGASISVSVSVSLQRISRLRCRHGGCRRDRRPPGGYSARRDRICPAVECGRRGCWPSSILRSVYLARSAATVDVGWQFLRRAAGRDRARCEASPRQPPIVHQDCAGNPDINAELSRNFHHVVATRDNLRRQLARFGPQDIGGLLWMREARQIMGAVQ